MLQLYSCCKSGPALQVCKECWGFPIYYAQVRLNNAAKEGLIPSLASTGIWKVKEQIG